MCAQKFSDTEHQIIDYISSLRNFEYRGQSYSVESVGKPTISKGEPKTDIYFCLVDRFQKKTEYKISLKMDNADFLENKIRLERAKEILGQDAHSIIYQSCLAIRDEFLNSEIVNFTNTNRAKDPYITLGWKFELMNKLSGKKSGKIILSDQQKNEVFSGQASPKNKTAQVNGQVIKNSGIANYFLQFHDKHTTDLKQILDDLVPLESYAKTQDIYFACKALNYIVPRDKWDGDRPLAVWIKWTLENGIASPEFIFDNPLQTKGHYAAQQLKTFLQSAKISPQNFHSYRHYFSPDIAKY